MIYTIVTDNPNALAEYFRLSGGADDVQVSPFSHAGTVLYAVTLLNPSLDHDRLLNDITVHSQYDLSSIKEADFELYRLWENGSRIAADMSGSIYAVVSKESGVVEGLFVFGCMPWDNAPVTFVGVDGCVKGNWLASIWSDKAKVSMSGILKASIYDFTLRPLNCKKGTQLLKRGGQLVLVNGQHETHNLIPVNKFEL